jgi:asparagine synthetase B (glutamine-hydrolysing)
MFKQCAPQVKVKTYTIGHTNCKDGKYANQIARNLGYDHTLIPVDETYIRNYSEECVWRAEGNLSILESWIFAGDKYLQKNHFKYAMSGVAGNLIFGSQFTPEILNAKNNDDIKRYILSGPTWHFKRATRILKPSLSDQAVEGTFDSIWHSFGNIKSNSLPQKFNGLMSYQYERRHGSSEDALGDYTKTLNPFFDNQLFDFVMRIPPQIRGERTLCRKMQVKHISKVAKVATIYDDLPIGISARLEKYVFLRKAYHLPIRIKKRLVPTSDLWDDPKEYVYPNTWMRTREKDFILQILNMTEYLEDYLNMDEVQKIINNHENGIKREAEIIGAIVTFALWRKRFCD